MKLTKQEINFLMQSIGQLQNIFVTNINSKAVVYSTNNGKKLRQMDQDSLVLVNSIMDKLREEDND